MGSSSGSGSFVFGGSLSSSTLSPLAPPFNFDKTHQNPNLTNNTSVNFFEGPFYGSVFDPAGPFWGSSSSPPASIPTYVAPESTCANTSCPTTPEIYSYQVPPYNDPGVICNPFSYTQFHKRMSTDADETAKHYHPPYVYPPSVKDGYVRLSGGVKGADYDFLSNSDSANCTGFGSSSVEHTQGLSFDGDHKPKWGDFRTGVNDGEHSEWKEYSQCFGSKGTGFSSDKSHFPVDGTGQIHPFCETSNECLLKQGSHVSQGVYDIFSGAYPSLSLGTGQQGYKSAFDLKLGGISDENPHVQKPVLEESVASFCGPRTTTGINDCSIPTGSFVFSCSSATTTTPIARTKPPYGGSKFTLSGTKLIPEIPPGLKSRSSIVIKRPLSSLIEPSSTQIGQTGNKSVIKDTSDVIFSAEKHSGESDIRNPSEDSPCWKGASSMRFAPFGVSDTGETQCRTSCVDNSHSKIDISAEEINESISRVPSVIGNGLSSGDKSSFKLCQSSGKVSDSIIDVNMQLMTMMNISEELRDYCRNNPAVVMQNHSETIKHIIDNLSDCISTIDPPMLASEMGNTSESVTAAVKLLRRRTEDFLELFPFKDDDSIISGNDNIAEGIKKIMLENIKDEEMEQHKILYKDLWIEAEAALCAMTAKARLHHMKIEMEKAFGTTKEMGRFPVSSIPADVQSFRESKSKDKDSPALVVHDCSTSVKGRYQILKDRIDPSDSHDDYKGELSLGEEDNCLIEKDNSSLENNCVNVVDTSSLARFLIIKSRDDKADALNDDGQFYLPDNVFQNPHLLDSFSGSGDVEASVMERVRILQNQISSLNARDKYPTPEEGRKSVADEGTQGQGWSKQVRQTRLFGPYSDFSKYDNVKEFDICGKREAGSARAFEGDNLSSKIVEGWYENGYSSSEWEHVCKEDLQRQP